MSIRNYITQFFAALLVIFIVTASGYAQPTGYGYYKQITLNTAQITGTHSNFPILISITDSDLVGKTQGDGDDIIFASDTNGSTIYDHQMESYNSSTGTYRAWVRIPTLSDANNTLVMFYGNSSATNTSSTNTWDNNYQLVMHMNDVNDQSGNGNNGTNNGTVSIAGKIGNARDFERGDNDFITVADDNTLDITGSITISFWFRQESAQAPDYITKGQNESYEATSRGGIRTRFAKNGGNNLTTPNTDDLVNGAWVYLTFVQSNSGRNIYQDAVSVANDNNTDAFNTNNNDLQISRSGDAVDGIMDEIRISNVARSANWISTEYNNQNTPGTFHTFGAEMEAVPPTAPQNVAALALPGGNIRITFDDVDETGSGVASYSVERSTVSGSGYTQVGTVTDDESVDYTFTDNTANDGTTYYYIVTAIDANGNESVNSSEVSATSDGTAPSLQTASVNGNSLALNYDEVLDNGSVPAFGDYTITVNSSSVSISNITVSNDSVLITLNNAVIAGDNIVLNYNSGSNPVQDNTGNNASNLSNQNITNNTPDVTAPGIPQNIEAIAVAGGSIEVTFDDLDEIGSGVSSYSVKRSTVQGGSYVQVGTVNDNESAVYTYQDNSTTNDIIYYYVVSAIDASSNEGANSSEVFATADSDLPQIQTVTVNGELLRLDYNETLDNTSIPATTDFTVSVNSSTRSVTNVSISTSLVTLTLNPEAEEGDVVVVSYTPGSNRIQDPAGNEAASLSNQSVTNNTTAFNVTPPSVVTATAIVDADIQIEFTDVGESGEVSSYSVKRSTTENGTYSEIGTVSDNESSNYTFTDNTSVDGTLYYYVVTAIDDNSNESTQSSKVSATADGTDPSVESILSGEASVLLDYDELLDINSVPSTSDFVVSVNGSSVSISSVTVSNVRVVVELVNSIQSGDNVTLSYTSGSNPIKDIAGNNAANFSNQSTVNYAKTNIAFGPDPCPIVNGNDASWACFDGVNNGTSMTARVGDLDLATVTAASGSQTIFAPNALQEWSSGTFSDDEFNGPQINPTGNANNATSFDINIPSTVPSDAIIFSLNKLRPESGGTSYTLEAFDGTNTKVPVNGWITGQGGDGGICSNSINLNYTNSNTTIEFQPTVSGNQACASSSNPIWFRINNTGIERIEIRKISTNPDNIHLGLALVADYGDAPNSYRTNYNSRGTAPAFHLLSNTGVNNVYLGAGVDGDGNGASGTNANGDDSESTGIGSGDDEDGSSALPTLRTNDQNYSIDLVCTDGGKVGGWIDINQNGVFDSNEYAFNECSGGVATLNWGGLSGLITGSTFARFRIASNASEIANPFGVAFDGEVEDYTITIDEPATPDLGIVKTVDNSNPIEGEEIEFTVSVTNPGEFTATGIQVTDQLPSGITYVSHSVSQGTYNNSTGVWNIGTLAEGDTTTVSLTLTATVNNGTVGSTITNSASITGLNENDPDLSNNSESAGITVVNQSTDIGITKIADKSQAIEGENITYTIVATNNGPRNATNVKLIDQIPSGLSFESSNPSVGSYISSTGIWDVGSLNNSAQASLVLVLSVDVGSENSTITNTASLNSIDQTDTNTGNNTASADVDIVAAGFPATCSEVTSLNFDNATLISGSAGQVGAIYRFLSVTSGVNAEIEIVTNLNANLVNFDQSTSGTSQNFQPQIEAVDKNAAEAYIDFEVRFLDSLSGNPRFLTFTATAVDVDGDNNDTREFVGFQRLTSFTVEDATSLVVGSSGIYTTFESATSQVVNGIDPTDTDNIAYTTYTNEPQFRIRGGIKDPTNTTGGAAQRLFSINFEPCLINNFSDPSSENIVEVGVTKTVDNNNPSVGENITYTVTATNNQGNSVGNVKITDQLPSGLTPVSATPSTGTYSGNIWDIGTLNGLQSANLVITATVNSGTEGNTITNTATITDFTGTDGNTNNNTSSIKIFVNDPGSTVCSEPPLFNFNNFNLEQGVTGQVNSIYRFSAISPGLDALVKVKAISNATIDQIDDNGLGNSAANFSPLFTATQSGGYIDWEIRFVQAGTNNPVKRNFSMTALDIDGSDQGGGQTIRDFLGFSQNQSNTVQSGNNLTETTSGAFQFFTSNVSTDGSGSFDIDHMAYILYRYTSVLEFRMGSNTTGGYTDDRLVDIDFTQCRNQDFTNPVTTTRNADISVVKTVDNPNPLANENVNFTITVANNGPENATEVDVNETLPSGLTLVQATPSKGTYNQISKIWAIGSLANNTSATLLIEASVNSGVTADSLVNKAFLLGLNQFDNNATNDTSTAVVKISDQIDGVVFRDRTGNGITDGDNNFGDASGDQTALADVVVHLFKDGGDGNPNGTDDTYLRADTTDISGFFSFQIGEDADYWVVVNSKTGSLSNGSTWGEQVYAPKGGICSDGNGTSNTKTSAGNCFGGRRGNQSDNLPTGSAPLATDLANAEHVAKITLNSAAITDIDFGFSFNVVTDTRDGDDDGSSNRSIQGSLRQFISNANAISGANTMRFVPSIATNEIGSGGNWWKITLNSELPAITDPLTTLDGRSFNLNSPLAVLNPNSGTIGTGSTVGIDGISLTPFERKELEVDLNDVGNNALSINSTGAVVIRHFALFNNSRTIVLTNISGGTVENNMIGSRADGTDPTGVNQSDLGILITGSSSQTPLIQRNYIAYTKDSGLRSDNASATIQFTKNEVYRAGNLENNADGLEGIGTWSITQNLFHENGKSNGSDIYGGSGIELGNSAGTVTSGNTIRNNTIRDHRTTGINVLNQVSSTLIEKNIITGNGTDYLSAPFKGAGVRLSFPDAQPQQGVFITKNSFSNNKGLAIDIVTSGNGEADGVSPNDGVIETSSTEPNRGLDYPVFTLATIDGTQLTVEGYIGKNATRITGSYSIEIYKAANDNNQDGLIEEGGSLIRPHGEGQTLIGTITTNANGTFSETFTVSSTSIVVNDRITALTFDSGNNTSEFSSNQRVVNTGVTINGYVYEDGNHNALREGNENGIESVTIVLFNKNLNNCKSVLTDANGFYQFSNVLNGEYDLIESFGQSVPTPDVCTPAEVDPTDHISTTPNLRTVIVNNLPAQQNFGDFEGSKITGTVFNDNGIGGGAANDGTKNGTENGIATIVKALTGSDALIEQTSTNPNGIYTLFVPKSAVANGGTIKIQEVNNPSFITIDGAVGTTGGSYSKTTDVTTFTNILGTSFTGVDFADVQESVFNTDGSQNVLPGAIAVFQHTFNAKTSGNVIFTTSSINNPSNVSWPVILYNDLNCNGNIDSGETILDGSTPVSVVAEQTVCLLLKVNVPQGLDNGSTSNTTISAVMDYLNTSPVIQQNLSRGDLVTVSNEEAGLVLTKSVDQAQALPGSILTYSVSYQNNGDEPISSLEIIDNTPNYTSFNTAACGALPNNLTACTITSPAVGSAGGIKWTFTGTLQPGGSGTVTFTVKIDN